MTRLGTGAVTAAVLLAAGIGAAWSPTVGGQVKVRRSDGQGVVELLAGGHSGRIGVSVRDVDAETAKTAKLPAQSGVVIEEVRSDSPAAKAGFREGDVVIEFDGERIRSTRQFARVVQESVPGRQVAAVALRDGQRTPLNVTPEAGGAVRYLTDRFDYEWPLPAVPVPPAAPAPPAPPALPDRLWRFDQFPGQAGQLGVTIDELSPQLAEYFGTTEGVLVTSVASNSAAAKAGLKAGDVITALDGATVTTPADLRRRAQRLEDGDEFTLAVMRDKKPLTLKGKVEARQPRRWTTII